MLKPSKDDPNYEEQMKQFNQDNSSWGVDATKADIVKGTAAGAVPTPAAAVEAQPEPAAATVDDKGKGKK